MIAKNKTTKKAIDGQIMNIFGKEKKGGKMRYWVSVSTPETDGDGNKTGEYFNASMACYLSESALGWFDAHATATKNACIYGGKFIVTDYWLKAVPGQDNDFVALFINEMHCDEE